ncbi:hypothetical protein LH53_04810 [Mesotoga sp. TolDC]|nr:hypothetical protein LH53_04810 [Mesotoga sp. TolDC]
MCLSELSAILSFRVEQNIVASLLQNSGLFMDIWTSGLFPKAYSFAIGLVFLFLLYTVELY